MGILFIEGSAIGPDGRSRMVKFMLDSGVRNVVLPEDVWQEIGLPRRTPRTVKFADGTTIRRESSKCRIALLGSEATVPVLLGVAGDQPVLGNTTLKKLGLVLDPFQRTLKTIDSPSG